MKTFFIWVAVIAGVILFVAGLSKLTGTEYQLSITGVSKIKCHNGQKTAFNRVSGLSVVLDDAGNPIPCK